MRAKQTTAQPQTNIWPLKSNQKCIWPRLLSVLRRFLCCCWFLVFHIVWVRVLDSVFNEDFYARPPFATTSLRKKDLADFGLSEDDQELSQYAIRFKSGFKRHPVYKWILYETGWPFFCNVSFSKNVRLRLDSDISLTILTLQLACSFIF